MNRFNFILSSFFIFNILSAETIGNFQYYLPGSTQNWKIEYEKMTDKCFNSKTILYVPKDSKVDGPKDEFLVCYVGFPGKTLNQSNSEFNLKLILSM